MLELRTEIIVRSPPQRVWKELISFQEFPHWNPFIVEATGEPRVGQRLSVRLHPEGKRSMRFRPTVEFAEPDRELRWIGHLGIRGLFDGQHRFAIETLDNDRVRFVQSERFGGILVRLIMNRGMVEATRRGFESMNHALKERVESSVAHQ